MKLTFLVDNKTENSRCLAEWGFSVLIESEGHTYLYDTGTTSMFAENAEALGLDLSRVEALFFSHSHDDHTGGMQAFYDRNKTCPIYLQREALISSYSSPEDAMADRDDIGIPWSADLKESLKSRLVLTDGVTEVNGNLTLISDIPSAAGFKPTERFFTVRDGKIIPDPMRHEQAVVVEEQGRLHILSGCSHKGVIPTVEYVEKLFPGKEIASYTGGFHAYMLTNAATRALAQELISHGIKTIIPMHCTGLNTIAGLRSAYGDDCRILSAGSRTEL